MTEKYTQGEWKVGLDDEYADGCPGIEIVDPYGSVIAYAVADPDEGITDEDRANARLIAAAPKLLEALEVVVQCPEHGWGLKEALELQQQCKTAIAAATEGRK